MYTVPSAFNTKLSTGNWLPCYLWVITPNDPTVDPIRFCDHNEELTVDIGDGDGPQVFSPSILTNLSEIQSRIGTDINTHDVEGASLYISAEGVDRDDILGAKFDDAVVTVAICDRNAPADGAMVRFRGYVHDVSYQQGFWKIQVISHLKKLETEPFKTIAPECEHNLGKPIANGNPGCGVKGILTEPSVWTAETNYTRQSGRDRNTESLVRPSTPNGFYYYPSVSGESDVTEPAWPTTAGDTVVDGTVTWVAIVATRQLGEVLTIVGPYNRSFTVDVGAPNNYFSHGKIEFVSGRNIGKTYPTLNYINDAGVFTVQLVYQPFLPIEVGDEIRLVAGCSKAFFDTSNGCKAFRNQLNFSGFMYVPGEKIRNQVGNRTE